MGKDIHYSILDFFNARMNGHSSVKSIDEVSDENDYIFRITRKIGYPSVDVHLSDAYAYGDIDYIQRPSCLGPGDFIMIAKPEGNYNAFDVERAKSDSIGFGRIGKLMGALNFLKVWEYKSPEELEEEKRWRRA